MRARGEAPSVGTASCVAAPASEADVDAIIEELGPLMARQRHAMAERWCFKSLSGANIHLLMILESHGTMPMTRLAELQDVSLPTMSGIVDRMVDRGLVERVRDDEDRRLVLVSVSPAGRAAIEEFELVRRQHLALVLGRLRPSERQLCLRAVRLMRRAAEELDAPAEAASTPGLPRRPDRRRPSTPSVAPNPR